MHDRNTAELNQFLSRQEAQEAEYELKRSEFERAPYDHCEFNEAAFSKYDLLSIALEYYAGEIGIDWTAGPCSKKDFLAAVQDSINKVEL